MIRFTNHAIERYIERVRPAFDERQAFQELRRIAHQGAIHRDPPPWIESADPNWKAIAWLWFGDITFPLIKAEEPYYGYACSTCLTRGSLAPEERANRRNQKSGRGQRKKHIKRSDRRLSKRTRSARRGDYDDVAVA